jgi:hypothetical protein
MSHLEPHEQKALLEKGLQYLTHPTEAAKEELFYSCQAELHFLRTSNEPQPFQLRDGFAAVVHYLDYEYELDADERAEMRRAIEDGVNYLAH